jgi:hypothetical protein
MRSFAIHRRDGYVVGIVTTEADDAPPIMGTDNPDQIVTEVAIPDGGLALSDPDSEKMAPEALQAFRIERRLVRKGRERKDAE